MSKEIEAQVKANAALLDIEMPGLLKSIKGKYVAFNQGNIITKDNYNEAFTAGTNEFGADVGFVVREITDEPIVMSNLVTL